MYSHAGEMSEEMLAQNGLSRARVFADLRTRLPKLC